MWVLDSVFLQVGRVSMTDPNTTPPHDPYAYQRALARDRRSSPPTPDRVEPVDESSACRCTSVIQARRDALALDIERQAGGVAEASARRLDEVQGLLDALAERDDFEQDRNHWQDCALSVAAERDQLRADLAAVAPVVRAAKKIRGHICPEGYYKQHLPELRNAIDALDPDTVNRVTGGES